MAALWAKMPGFSEAILLGNYVTGLESATPPNIPAVGLVWPGWLVITNRWGTAELGRIDLSQVRDVQLAASDEIENMDVGRVLLVGLFALGWKKRVRTAQLLITLSTRGGGERGVLFDFGEGGWPWSLAKQALDQVQSLLPEVSPESDTRKCPYCAETIRAEAIICRFCNRSVSAHKDDRHPRRYSTG